MARSNDFLLSIIIDKFYKLVLVVDDVSHSLTKHSISRPIRTETFFRKASDWSASADLAAKQTETVQNLSR